MTSPTPAYEPFLAPASLGIGQTDQSLSLTLHKKMTGRFTLTRVVLRIPRGTGPTDLTAGDHNALTVHVAEPQLWRPYREPVGSTAFDIGVVSKKPAGVTGAQQVVFSISGLAVNDKTGTATVLVHEKHRSETNPRATQRPITKTDGATFSLRNLQPRRFLIEGGETATLTWQVTPDHKHTITGYDLTYSTPLGPVTTHPSPQALSAETGPLQQDGPVQLTAHVTKPPSTTSQPITLTSYVTVAGPRLNQVGAISAHDNVALLDQPYNHAGALPGYTRNTTHTEHHTNTFTATTDGLLLLSAQTETGAQASVRLHLHDPAGTLLHTEHLTTGPEASLTLPIPSGHRVELDATAERPPTSAQPNTTPRYWLTVNWQPLGIGPLTCDPHLSPQIAAPAVTTSPTP
ncbi:hypothetical protein [Streptomyces sp. NPDC054874]